MGNARSVTGLRAIVTTTARLSQVGLFLPVAVFLSLMNQMTPRPVLADSAPFILGAIDCLLMGCISLGRSAVIVVRASSSATTAGPPPPPLVINLPLPSTTMASASGLVGFKLGLTLSYHSIILRLGANLQVTIIRTAIEAGEHTLIGIDSDSFPSAISPQFSVPPFCIKQIGVGGELFQIHFMIEIQ